MIFKLPMVLALMGLSLLTRAATGVALVHGTGSHKDAYNEYWQSGMVESIRQGLPNGNNLFVINCDFEQFMWSAKASGCLATQLSNFIQENNIDDLYVITHSNGGNVMRWILSNPTWDSRYPAIINTIREVTAISTTSAGTPLADAVFAGNVFENVLGGILGYKSDAVKMQQTSWMAYYNSTWLLGTERRPSLPVTFRNIVGSEVETAPWDSDSYCGDYSLNLALEITKGWLESCSDGFVNCSSQSAAGTLWFLDTERTRGGEPLNHNQSRRQCFDLDIILREAI